VNTLLRMPALINQALALEDRSAPDRETGRGALGPFPRPRPDVPDGPGRRPEAQGNQLHPRRGLCQRRAEARPHRAVDNNLPVIVLAPRDALFDKTVSNMQEVMARDGKVWLVSDADGVSRRGRVWATLTLPTVDPIFAPHALRRSGAADRLPHRPAQGHRRGPAAQPREIRDGGMTPEVALAALRAEADPDRAAQMRAYHKVGPPLSRPVQRTGERIWQRLWRKSTDLNERIALAQGPLGQRHLRGADRGGKLFLQARIRPDDTPAWDVPRGIRARDFDSWAIADAVAQAGQKRLLADPGRLDEVETWTRSDHMWTRRAALVFTLGFTKSRHPGERGGRGARPGSRLVRGLRGGSRVVHPEGRRMVGARAVEEGSRPRRGVPRGPWRTPETLGAKRGRATHEVRGAVSARKPGRKTRVFRASVRPSARHPEAR
jgi:hypothetical protein